MTINQKNTPYKDNSFSARRKKNLLKKKHNKARKLGIVNKAPAEKDLVLLLDHYQNGRFNVVINLAHSITERFSDHPFAWNILGATFLQLKRFDEALLANQKLLKISPRDPRSHNNLAATLHEIGRLAEAELSYQKAISIDSNCFVTHNNLGNILFKTNRYAEAEKSYRKAISLKYDYLKANCNLAATLEVMGQLDEAEASYRNVILLEPNDPIAHNNLGNILVKMHKHQEAEEAYKRAIFLKGDYPEPYHNLGNIYLDRGKSNEAEEFYKHAFTVDSKYAEAYRMYSLVKKFKSKNNHYSKMQALYGDQNISDEQRCSVCFALGKAHEDMQEYEQAFKFFSEGNSLRNKVLGYDISEDIDCFSQIRSTYSKLQEISLGIDQKSQFPKPIFIVGMPRSGTTLVEQIISSHSKVTGAGELAFVTQFGESIARGLANVSKKQLLSFQKKYLSSIKNLSEDNFVLTDKMPHNFLYLGLIASAFPDAKIIHVKRNPSAICWANYKNLFASPKLGYSHNLNDIADYYLMYKNLMEFWHMSFGDRIYQLDYDLLTTNQRGETKRLISHLDLEWEQACLNPQDNMRIVQTTSNFQVRKKIYQGSSDKWKNFKPFLNNIFDGL